MLNLLDEFSFSHQEHRVILLVRLEHFRIQDPELALGHLLMSSATICDMMPRAPASRLEPFDNS